MKHGAGKIVMPDGSHYEGSWQDDMMHGAGSFLSALFCSLLCSALLLHILLLSSLLLCSGSALGLHFLTSFLFSALLYSSISLFYTFLFSALFFSSIPPFPLLPTTHPPPIHPPTLPFLLFWSFFLLRALFLSFLILFFS